MSAQTWREVADFVAEQGEAIYPRDVFTPPSPEMLDDVNALLWRERGHKLDGIAAECMRRAYAAAAHLIRERAADMEAPPMTATEPTPTAEHIDAVARVLCDAEGFIWPDTEKARDVWRVKAHASMLDALVRAGVLTKIETAMASDGKAVMHRRLVTRWEVAP